MARIKRHGRPTTKTAGVIGDIYVDKQTGLTYKCTFAYGVGNDREYTWIETNVDDISEEMVIYENPEVKPVKPIPSREPVTNDETDTEDISDRVQPKRNNYRNHFKNSKH